MSAISEYLKPGKKAFLVGIGGVSMCPLAEELNALGLEVSGSDLQISLKTDELSRLGMKIHIGHSSENLAADTDFLVRTAAAKDDNPEVVEARRRRLPVFERAQAWGEIMRGYKNAVCVSGTHGKTTTTSMVTHILMASGFDPTVMIGGFLPLLQSGHRIGKGETIVMESCEYCNSFLNFFPTVAVITNIEAEHLDFFKDLDDVAASFRKFAELIPENGAVVANADDENTMRAVSGIGKDVITFGFSEAALVRGQSTREGDYSGLDVYLDGKPYTRLKLKVMGRHNALNALAACAASIALGVSGEDISKGLGSFTGAGRRMERKGVINGALILDDYAHHPSELRALLEAVKAIAAGRIICVFQPHTYSRTKALFGDFVAQLSKPDISVLADIYAAREKNTVGISSADLAAAVPGAKYIHDFEAIAEYVSQAAMPGDVILTVGAGDIYRVGDILAKKTEKSISAAH